MRVLVYTTCHDTLKVLNRVQIRGERWPVLGLDVEVSKEGLGRIGSMDARIVVLENVVTAVNVVDELKKVTRERLLVAKCVLVSLEKGEPSLSER